MRMSFEATLSLAIEARGIGEPPEGTAALEKSYRGVFRRDELARKDIDIVYEKKGNSPLRQYSFQNAPRWPTLG